MKRAQFVLSLAAVVAAATIALMPSPKARAQLPSGGSLAAAFPPIIPLHHRQFYFSSGAYIGAFQLNPSTSGNNNCPETIVFLPPWVIDCSTNPAGGTVVNGPAGVTQGTLQIRHLQNGLTSYRFVFQSTNVFTQIWSFAKQQKRATGFSNLTGQAYWENNPNILADNLLQQDVNFSALGPPFHRYPSLNPSSFSLHLAGEGSGQGFQWSLNGQQKNSNGLFFIQFNITPQ
jgi:hypothetical protein